MALLNQLPLMGKDGTPIPAGSVISFKTEFKPRVNTMDISLFIWYNQTAFNTTTVSPLTSPCIQIEKYSWIKGLTAKDFQELTPLKVHEYIKEYIEAWGPEWEGKLTII